MEGKPRQTVSSENLPVILYRSETEETRVGELSPGARKMTKMQDLRLSGRLARERLSRLANTKDAQ